MVDTLAIDDVLYVWINGIKQLICLIGGDVDAETA